MPVQDDLLHFPAVVRSLRNLGVNSLMVEGGARVISSLIGSHSDLIDVIIVTVAPVFVGDRGIAYHANLNHVRIVIVSSLLLTLAHPFSMLGSIVLVLQLWEKIPYSHYLPRQMLPSSPPTNCRHIRSHTLLAPQDTLANLNRRTDCPVFLLILMIPYLIWSHLLQHEMFCRPTSFDDLHVRLIRASS